MTAENFVYWLKGFLDLSQNSSLASSQVQEIKEKIELALQPKVSPISSMFAKGE